MIRNLRDEKSAGQKKHEKYHNPRHAPSTSHDCICPWKPPIQKRPPETVFKAKVLQPHRPTVLIGPFHMYHVTISMCCSETHYTILKPTIRITGWRQNTKHWVCGGQHSAETALSRLTENSKCSRFLKTDITCKKNKCRRQTFSGDYSQQFVIYNKTGRDVSQTVAYTVASYISGRRFCFLR